MRLSDLPPEVVEQLIRDGFGGVPLHRHFEMALVQLEPTVHLELPLTEKVRGFSGPLHGGALAAGIDVAANAAAGLSGVFELGKMELITLDLHIRYLSQPQSGPITIEATLVHEGRRLLQIACSVFDGDHNLVALADVASMVTGLGAKGREAPGSNDGAQHQGLTAG